MFPRVINSVAFWLGVVGDVFHASGEALREYGPHHRHLSRVGERAVSAAWGLVDLSYALAQPVSAFPTVSADRTVEPPPASTKRPVTFVPEPDDEPSAYDVLEELVLSGRAVVRVPDRCPARVFVDADEDTIDMGLAAVVGG
jgi:hypothetical protein